MNLGVPELIIIFLIILVLFGAGKIPAIAKDMGKGIREFKKAMHTDDEEEQAPAVKVAAKATRKRAKKS